MFGSYHQGHLLLLHEAKLTACVLNVSHILLRNRCECCLGYLTCASREVRVVAYFVDVIYVHLQDCYECLARACHYAYDLDFA